MARSHHIHQEGTSITEWSVVIHPDPVLVLHLAWCLASLHAQPSCAFSTQYRLHHGGCPRIITCRITEHISEMVKVKFILEGSFRLSKHLIIALTNNEFLNIFVIQKTKYDKSEEPWIFLGGRKPSNQPQILSKLCASLRMAVEGGTAERHSISLCFMYLTEKWPTELFSNLFHQYR